jgi:hypothetical protein
MSTVQNVWPVLGVVHLKLSMKQVKIMNVARCMWARRKKYIILATDVPNARQKCLVKIKFPLNE